MELVDRLIPRKLLPPGTDWFIAGGYAAHKGLATDIDVWVPSVRTDVLEDVVDTLRRWLTDGGFAFRPLDDPSSFDYDGIEVQIRKVAEVTAGPSGVSYVKPFHIMVTDGNHMAVLDNFDVSTHQIALMPNGEEIRGPGWTAIWDTPVKLRDEAHTPARMAKISARYAHFREKGQLGQEAE